MVDLGPGMVDLRPVLYRNTLSRLACPFLLFFFPPPPLVGTGPARLLQASVSAGFDAASDPELFAVLRTVDVEGEAARVARATATDAHRRARTVAAEREVHMVRPRHRASCNNSRTTVVVGMPLVGSHFR